MRHPDRTSLKECRKLLKADKRGLRDQEVLDVRDFIHNIAKMYYDYYMRCKKGLHKSRGTTFDDPKPEEKSSQDIFLFFHTPCCINCCKRLLPVGP